jgi:hypothetical protein
MVDRLIFPLSALISQGKTKPSIAGVFPLENAR